jgi:hypothetical protein
MNRLFRATAVLTVELRAAPGTDRPHPIGRGIVIEGPGNDLVAIAVIVLTYTLFAVAAADSMRTQCSS